MKTRQEILNLLEKNREEIRSFGVKEIGLFGSVARDEQTEASDVDILVELEKKTFDAYMSLKFFLEDLFERKVDLVMKGTIKPLVKDRILSETIYVKGL
ncbi:nucleotidyltransferase family protein [soil metagenome]|jgi:predicted nucleotidyltransferase|nr:nucleotidyltransferase family protein [Acidobacteriota bacterium]